MLCELARAARGSLGTIKLNTFSWILYGGLDNAAKSFNLNTFIVAILNVAMNGSTYRDIRQNCIQVGWYYFVNVGRHISYGKTVIQWCYDGYQYCQFHTPVATGVWLGVILTPYSLALGRHNFLPLSCMSSSVPLAGVWYYPIDDQGCLNTFSGT